MSTLFRKLSGTYTAAGSMALAWVKAMVTKDSPSSLLKTLSRSEPSSLKISL